jgi:hypothetical protein
MSNASRCLAMAAHYARLADRAGNVDSRASCRRLERLFRDMAPLAETYDRQRDESAKERIYALTDEIGALRRKVA